MAQELLNTSTVARMLGISPRTLKDWRCKERGPKWISIGKNTVRYRMADVEQFINQRGKSHGEG